MPGLDLHPAFFFTIVQNAALAKLPETGMGKDILIVDAGLAVLHGTSASPFWQKRENSALACRKVQGNRPAEKADAIGTL